MTKSILTLLLASSTLTACAAGPDYHRPQTAASAAQPFIGAANPAVDELVTAAGPVAVSADGSRVAVGGPGKQIRVWDLASGKELHKLETKDIAVPVKK